MPKSKPLSYRLHWIEQAGEARIIRWMEPPGGVVAARDAALGVLVRSMDGAVRVEMLDAAHRSCGHVFTGRRGIEDWSSSTPLPRKVQTAWSRRIEERRRRLVASNEFKDRLRSAVADGVLDLDGAARVASALDVAVASGAASRTPWAGKGE
ncbi:hypothetical protein EQZ23_06855 [Sphingomonas sp. UV9]|nr:hypothetical protein EQZ23_06855 [Sphingomonas sp. UV9]